MINLTISGRIGQDAKEIESGCVFSLATTKRGFTTKDGKVIEDKTIWFNVFGRKNLTPHIKKGGSLTVYTDFISTQVYEGKAQLSCRAISIEFGSSNQNQSSAPTPQPEAQNIINNAPPTGEDDNMPF